MVDPTDIINIFYSENDPAREILLLHSTQVRNKALSIARRVKGADLEIISTGAMLHDIGIRFCHAPALGCFGDDDYLLHGILGAEHLRFLGFEGCEIFASICEKHTGSGISADEIFERKMALPERDYLPETTEEKIICLADKFFSKSGDMQEKTVEQIRAELEKFGKGPLSRFELLCTEYL